MPRKKKLTLITDLDALRQSCEPLEFLTSTGVDKTEVDDIIAKLKEVLNANKNLLAIAAPQIGIKKRVFCIRFSDTIKTFINPIITKKSGSSVIMETCSSMPGKEILIARPKEVTVVYYTDEFKYEDNKLLDTAAAIFDQQVQILDGVLPDALGMVSDIEADGKLEDLSDDELAEIIEYYKTTFIPAKQAQFEDVKDDPDYRKLKLSEDIINGRAAVLADKSNMNRAQRRAAIKASKGKGKNRRKHR